MSVRTIATVVVFLIALTGIASAREADEYYYAIAQGNQVCGYARVIISQSDCNDRPCIVVSDSLWMDLKVLGKSIEGKYVFQYHVDPEGGQTFHHSSYIDQGSTPLDAVMEFTETSARIVSSLATDTSMVDLPPDIILPNTRLYRYLVRFFVEYTLTSVTRHTFSEIDGTVNEATYTLKGRSTMEFAGRDYDALEVEAFNLTTGIEVTL